MEALKIYCTSKIAEYFPLVEQAIMFLLAEKVCFSSAHNFTFINSIELDTWIMPLYRVLIFPELVAKWNGKKSFFKKRREKRITIETGLFWVITQRVGVISY
jgi:hypothetical protein